MISKLLTGGIDLPKLAATVAHHDVELSVTRNLISSRAEETNAALADHIGKATERMTTAERVQSDNTAQCQIRMNGLQDLIASRALGADVSTLRMKLDRLTGEVEDTYSPLGGNRSLSDRLDGMASASSVANLSAQVASLLKQVEALTAAKLSEVQARKAPKK